MGVSTHEADVIGYLGGALLAGCFIPQIVQVITTRSVHDISILWSLLYSSGLLLTTVYLIFKDAPAAWIPSVFELAGGLLVLALKLFFEHTAVGRRLCAAREHKQELKRQALALESAQAGNSKQQGAHKMDGKDPKGASLSSSSQIELCTALSSYGSGRFSSIFTASYSTDGAVSIEDVSIRSGRLHQAAPQATVQRRSLSVNTSMANREPGTPSPGGRQPAAASHLRVTTHRAIDPLGLESSPRGLSAPGSFGARGGSTPRGPCKLIVSSSMSDHGAKVTA